MFRLVQTHKLMMLQFAPVGGPDPGFTEWLLLEFYILK